MQVKSFSEAPSTGSPALKRYSWMDLRSIEGVYIAADVDPSCANRLISVRNTSPDNRGNTIGNTILFLSERRDLLIAGAEYWTRLTYVRLDETVYMEIR